MMRFVRTSAMAGLVAAIALVTACGKDSSSPTSPDMAAPGKVTNLAALAGSSSSIEVFWTAPGEDGAIGTAAQYDLRYSTIESTPWTDMTPVPGLPTPLSAGSSEHVTVTGLNPETAYYVRISAADDVPNWSEISNTATASTLCVGDEHWDFASMHSGHRLYASTIWNGALIGGGGFGDFGYPGIAQRWNGMSWEMLGVFRTVSGFGAERILSAVVYDGELIVAGSFERAEATLANNIAAYDGGSWTPLGSGLTWQLTGDNEPAVNALAVFQGQLIVGGADISHAGGAAAQNVARWTGSTWQALGTLPSVRALTVYNGSLFAGTGSGVGSDLANVHRWNGTSWEAIGTGMDGWVLALISDETGLIAGGTFSHIGGVTAHVARWNGSSWSALGSGDWNDGPGNAGVRALTVHGGDLIAGGSFKFAGGTAANGIARWNGISWQRMGCPPRWPALGTDFDVTFLGTFDGEVVAGYYDGVALWAD